MLSVNSYTHDYIDACRAAVGLRMSAYADVAERAPNAAIAAFEPLFFSTMVLALDASFCHRSRTLELKDGNPLNEVRVLCNSILVNGGVLLQDKQIKLQPETSVLGYRPGDQVKLNADDFTRLSAAFFAEIEARYSERPGAA